MSRRVSFIPERAIGTKNGGDSGTIEGANKKRGMQKVWIFKIPKGSLRFSPASFLRQIGVKVSTTLPALVPATSRGRCSTKVSSASFRRSRSYADTLDSQRAEAIEDCIEFLNSSSSLQRSNSVSSSC